MMLEIYRNVVVSNISQDFSGISQFVGCNICLMCDETHDAASQVARWVVRSATWPGPLNEVWDIKHSGM